jgi:hypothetical protein
VDVVLSAHAQWDFQIICSLVSIHPRYVCNSVMDEDQFLMIYRLNECVLKIDYSKFMIKTNPCSMCHDFGMNGVRMKQPIATTVNNHGDHDIGDHSHQVAQ